MFVLQNMLELPGMAGHTLTMTSSGDMYVIGGFSQQNYFSDRAYVYNTASAQWREAAVSGYRPIGIDTLHLYGFLMKCIST